MAFRVNEPERDSLKGSHQLDGLTRGHSISRSVLRTFRACALPHTNPQVWRVHPNIRNLQPIQNPPPPKPLFLGLGVLDGEEKDVVGGEWGVATNYVTCVFSVTTRCPPCPAPGVPAPPPSSLEQPPLFSWGSMFFDPQTDRLFSLKTVTFWCMGPAKKETWQLGVDKNRAPSLSCFRVQSIYIYIYICN